MAGMKFNADIDLKNIVKLRQEIDKLKKSLIEIASVPNSDAAIKQLESEIDRATKKLSEYKDSYAKLQKIKYDIDSSNSTVKIVKEETSALQSTNKWIIANTESVKEADRQIKQLKKDFSALSDEEKVGDTGTAKIRQIQQLAAQRLVEEEAVRKTIKAQKDQIIQSNAEEGSITALRKQLILLIKDYDDLGRVRRGGDAGKALLTQISNVQKELNAAEQASGRFQRNVGNYASAWNGLGNSVQQVARELPSLAVSANTFFLAISNNLPILVDEIAKARKEYANFKAELKAGNKDVKAVAPVWQQLTRSILSWQTALVVGLTLLSVYGKDVIKWIGSLGKARDVTLDLLSAEQEMALARKSAWSSIAKEQTQLDILYNKLKNVTLSTTERNAAVREWVKNYKTHSDILEGEKVSIDKLNKAYKELTKEIRNSAIARKYEDTLADMSIKREDEEIKRLNQKKTLYDAGLEMSVAQREYERVQREYDKGQTSSQVLSSARVRYLNAVDNWNKEKKVYVDAINTVKKYDENMAVIENHISTLDLFPQPKEGTYDYWQQQVEIADNALKQITSEQKKVLDEASKNSKKDLYGLGIDRAVVDSYKKAVKDKAEAEKQLKVYGDSSKEQKMSEKEAEKRKKEQEKLNEDLLSLRRQNQQAEIDLMEEGTEKKLKQIDLDYQKELDAIKKQEKDLSERQGGKLTSEQSIEISARYTNAENKREKDIADYYKDVLSKYQDYITKRLEIEKRFNADREKLQKSGASDAQLNELEYQRTETLNSIDKEFAMREESFQTWVDDITNIGLEKLRELLVQAERELERSEFLNPNDKGLAVQRAKVVSLKNTINKKSKETDTSPDKRSRKEWQELYKMLSKVEGEFDKIGSTVGGTAGEILSAAGSITSSTLQMIDGITLLANSSATAMEGTAKAASSAIKTVEKASVILAIIGAALQIATKIASLFDDSEAQQRRFEEYQRRQEGYWQSINYQTERYLELLKEAAGNDYFATATQSLTTLEKAREKAYKDIIKSMPVGDVDAVTFGLAQLFKSGKFAGKMTEYAFGGPQAKEIFDFIQANGGYDLENKLISEEAIWAMKSNADIWSKLPEWMQQAIDKFVEFNDKAKELEETLNEDLFQTTSKGIEEAILEGLKGGKRGIADFGEDFEEIMRNALLQSFVIDQLRGKAQEFYKKYTLLADSDKNGKLDLTVEEISDLRKDWNDIIRSATEEAKNIDAIVGASSSSSQEASKKGFATASQDSIDELNGRFTALQIAGEEIKSQNQLQTMSILELRADMLPIIANTTGIKDIASETRDLLRLSYEAIVDIRDNTNVIVKPIQQMASDIAEVKRNTSKL